MKHYYLEETIEEIKDMNGLTRTQAIEQAKAYFKNNFTEEELLELLIRGQAHTMDDERTNGYYNR